jgi:hypothetical protein
VPDCAYWGSLLQERALDFLLECIMLAFLENPDIILKCKEAQSERDIANLLEVIIFYKFLLLINVCSFSISRITARKESKDVRCVRPTQRTYG